MIVINKYAITLGYIVDSETRLEASRFLLC